MVGMRTSGMSPLLLRPKIAIGIGILQVEKPTLMLLIQWTQASACSSCVGRSSAECLVEMHVWHGDHY